MSAHINVEINMRATMMDNDTIRNQILETLVKEIVHRHAREMSQEVSDLCDGIYPYQHHSVDLET